MRRERLWQMWWLQTQWLEYHRASWELFWRENHVSKNYTEEHCSHIHTRQMRGGERRRGGRGGEEVHGGIPSNRFPFSPSAGHQVVDPQQAGFHIALVRVNTKREQTSGNALSKYQCISSDTREVNKAEEIKGTP